MWVVRCWNREVGEVVEGRAAVAEVQEERRSGLTVDGVVMVRRGG